MAGFGSVVSPMVSDHELVSYGLRSWAQLGPTEAGRVSRASGPLPWTPIMSRNHLSHGGCHASRACGLPWSPIMSTMGISDHEHMWGQLGPSFVPSPRWVSRVSCRLPWSPIMGVSGANGGRAGVTRFGPDHERVSRDHERQGSGKVSRVQIRGHGLKYGPALGNVSGGGGGRCVSDRGFPVTFLAVGIVTRRPPPQAW